MFISRKELNHIRKRLDAHQEMIANLAVNLTQDKMDLEEKINDLAKTKRRMSKAHKGEKSSLWQVGRLLKKIKK